MSRRDKGSGPVRKIVSVESAAELAALKEVLLLSGGRIIKELPLVNGYLCEFSGDGEISLASRDSDLTAKIEEDLEFKLCGVFGSVKPFWPFLNYPPFGLPPQAPKHPKKPLADGQQADWGLKRIGAPSLWGKLKETRTRVGIIDTGVNTGHPDLADNISEGISTLEETPSYEDDYGPGTHIAGIIGANSSYGITGINPYVDIYAVKAFNKNGKAKLSAIIEGLDWLIRRQINIINMSFSTDETNSALERVIAAAYARGTVLVAAAGNDRAGVNYPAKYPQVLAVSATDSRDRLAEFSCYGPEIDFCAPGVDIRSTWLGPNYAVKSGTSFAAPHISGAAADVLNLHGYMRPSQVKDLLAGKCALLPGLSQEQQGAGMVNLERLMES